MQEEIARLKAALAEAGDDSADFGHDGQVERASLSLWEAVVVSCRGEPLLRWRAQLMRDARAAAGIDKKVVERVVDVKKEVRHLLQVTAMRPMLCCRLSPTHT